MFKEKLRANGKRIYDKQVDYEGEMTLVSA